MNTKLNQWNIIMSITNCIYIIFINIGIRNQERLSYFEKQISKLGTLEDRFDEQQERIDRLEMTIEKVLSAVEDIDDSRVTRKIDKIDKQLAKLSTNIEKLASYVD